MLWLATLFFFYLCFFFLYLCAVVGFFYARHPVMANLLLLHSNV